MPPEGPAQMLDIYEHFDALIGERVDTASSLPAASSFAGRLVSVADDGTLRLSDGVGWSIVHKKATAPGSVVPVAGAGFTLSNNGLYTRNGWVLGTIDWAKTSGTLGHADVVCTLPAGARPPHEYVIGFVGAPAPSQIGHLIVTPAGEVRALTPISGRTNGSLKLMIPIDL
jgi:hypothetical protein